MNERRRRFFPHEVEIPAVFFNENEEKSAEAVTVAPIAVDSHVTLDTAEAVFSAERESWFYAGIFYARLEKELENMKAPVTINPIELIALFTKADPETVELLMRLVSEAKASPDPRLYLKEKLQSAFEPKLSVKVKR